jgi:hypothetical protein
LADVDAPCCDDLAGVDVLGAEIVALLLLGDEGDAGERFRDVPVVAVTAADGDTNPETEVDGLVEGAAFAAAVSAAEEAAVDNTAAALLFRPFLAIGVQTRESTSGKNV